MDRLNFTKEALARLLAGFTKRRLVHDSQRQGLCVELRSANAMSFYFYRWIDGRPQKIRLGGFPAMTVDQARREAAKLLGQVAAGANPAAERRAARVEHVFGQLFDWWLENHAKLNLRSWQQAEKWHARFLGHWKHRRLSSISRAEVAALHVAIGKKNGQTSANRVLALIRAVFNKADGIGYSGANPALRLQLFREKSRDRFLQPDEVPAFWESLQHEPALFQDFFTVALLTGARRRNVEAMRWEEVNLPGACWRIPQTKNDEPQLVHLPAVAVKILQRRHEENGSSEWVFPSRGKTGHLVEPKGAWKRIVERAGLADLRMHDLRRTLGSWQAMAGVSLPIIGKSLGHKSQQSTQVYARLNMEPVIAAVDAAGTALLAAMTPPKRKGARRGKSK
jgi:integrase